MPERFNAVQHIVEGWETKDPNALALVSIDARGAMVAEHSTSGLARQARAFARGLLDRGVRSGDRVFIMLPRIPQWYFAMLGAMRIGAVPMPAPNLLTSRDIAYRIQRAEPVAAVTDASGAVKIDAITDTLASLRFRISWAPGAAAAAPWESFDDLMAEEPEIELPGDPTSRRDPSLLYFTSGTVGPAKMVLHPQSYALGHIGTARFWQDLRPGDRHWTVTDTGWAKAAWGGLFGQWHERATVVQVALDRPEPASILSILASHAVTSFCAPPTLYRALVQADLRAYDLSRLRHCTSAGEPLNPEVIRLWRDGTGGLTVYDGYGQTETAVAVANYRSVPVRPGSMGLPVPGYTVEVLNETGHRARDGEVGNVAIRTEPRPVGLFDCYFQDADATAQRFRDGWYYTGDKASRDGEGYFWFEGREDDVITSSAYRIGPFDVESALLEHDAVVEAAVVGKPDPQRTEIVCAFVILRPGYKPSPELAADLQGHVKALTAPYKYPREVRFVDDLPKTVSGKIRRAELRHRLGAELDAGGSIT